MPEDSPIPIAKSTLKNDQRKLKKAKHSSSGSDDMDGGMESHQSMLLRVVSEVNKRKKAGLKVERGKAKSTLKNYQRKLKKVMEMKHSSSGADEMDGGMKSHRWIQGAIRGADGNYRKTVNWDSDMRSRKNQLFKYTEMALEDYNNKNQHEEFEVVQALHAQKRLLYPHGTEDNFENTGEWCHVFFVGRSKKDGVEKNFFAELMRLEESNDLFTVKTCFTLEPGKFLHECIICPPGLLLHPRKGEYSADNSSYTPVTWVTK